MPSCTCIPLSRPEKSDPLVDVERVLKDYAWETGARKTFWDRRCKDKLYELKVNWAYLDVSHRLVTFLPRRPGESTEDGGSTSAGAKKRSATQKRLKENVISRDMCLFRTEFTNNTSEPQTFTFKTERQTTSSSHVSVQKGWRVGGDLKLKFSVPSGPVGTPDLQPIDITGGLSGHYEVKKTEGEKFTETLTWSVDSQVQVEPEHRTVATLMVREEECVADFVIESTIRATHAAVPVKQFARKDDRLVDVLEIESHKLADLFKHQAGFYSDAEQGAHVIMCTTRGTFEAVYGSEQIIDIKSTPVEGSTAASSSSSASASNAAGYKGGGGLGVSGVKIEEMQ